MPLGVFWHNATTHQSEHTDRDFWSRHFDYVDYALKISTLAGGIRKVLLLDIDDDADSTSLPDSDGTCSTTSAESAISDSFRCSPTPL